MSLPTAAAIAALNDAFRTSGLGGQIFITAGIADLPVEDQAVIMYRVQTYSDFNADNDPHGEHDFGTFEFQGRKIFFKIDYYDPSLQYGSENPADPTVTTRVLTVMLAAEY